MEKSESPKVLLPKNKSPIALFGPQGNTKNYSYLRW